MPTESLRIIYSVLNNWAMYSTESKCLPLTTSPCIYTGYCHVKVSVNINMFQLYVSILVFTNTNTAVSKYTYMNSSLTTGLCSSVRLVRMLHQDCRAAGSQTEDTIIFKVCEWLAVGMYFHIPCSILMLLSGSSLILSTTKFEYLLNLKLTIGLALNSLQFIV
jgi:hypothetical protein